MSDPIVGIDLGTSNTVVAHAGAAGDVTVLADDAGSRIHPSVVSFHPGGGVIVGAAAKQRKVIDPQNTVYSVKRLIGRSYRSPEVQTARARSPFRIEEGPSNAPVIATRAGTFAVPEISAIVLDHARGIAAARLERPVDRAVVTVPASFNDAQRTATATAGAIAGLTVVRVLNEPTAAALAYGHSRGLSEIVAVYDFGGGTFDITLLRLEDQVYEVLGTSGDTFLGGDDLDERLVEKLAARFLSETRIDLRGDELAMMRLRAVAEQAKIDLSRRARSVVRLDEIAYGPRGAPLNLQLEIARDEFVREIADLVDRTFPVCREALALASLTVDRISDVILVGGTTRIPYVRDQVSKFFGKAPRTDINPEDAVATGAALQALALARILARRPSAGLDLPPGPAADEETTAGFPDILELADPDSGALRAAAELAPGAAEPTQRPRAGYPDGGPRLATEPTRPDTRYSMSRAGVRDETPGAERYPTAAPPPQPSGAPAVGFEDRPPPPGTRTQPLGRMARPSAPPQNRTVFGVPPAPSELELELGSSGDLRSSGLASPGDPGDDARAGRPITVTGTASPPPVPRPPRQAPRPPVAPGPADRAAADSAAETQPAAWVPRNPATTQPMAPTLPIAPPTAPTLVAAMPDPAAASTARGMGATIIADPSPATTARGFPPPASYPAPPVAAPPVPPPPVAPPPPAPVLLEVTPRGLGIATVAGFCEGLIRRNARVPTEARKLFTTSRDGQDLVRIVVCQGESRRLDQNTVIGDLVLQGLPPRPRGETSIEVTFALDASGVLHVRARDAQTGAEQRASLALVGDVAQEDVAASRDRLQQLRR